jgi:hypothetical protein
VTARLAAPVGVVVLGAACALAACGKKGPPLAPLRIAPGAAVDLSARRVGDDVVLRFRLPEKNDDGSAPADVARVEVYAISVARAADAPAAPAFVREAELIGRLETVPEHLSLAFVEPVAGRPVPAPREAAEKPAGRAGSGDPLGHRWEAAAAVDAEAAPAEIPVRVYAVVPISAKGRRGPLSATVAAPLEAPPAPPAPPVLRYTERAIVAAWVGDEEAGTYNVYAGAAAGEEGLPPVPLNARPLAEPAFEDARLAFGVERCYRVSALATVGALPIESAPSAPACITPIDTFPPAAPAGVAAVASAGAISLIWDAVEASDLAGYRGLARRPGG